MREITVSATLDNIQSVTDFVEEHLLEAGFPMKTVFQINIAVDELFSNIARYAYGEDEGEATVRLQISEDNSTAVLTFIDSGTPYNPLKKEDPDVTLDADDRDEGGLGIYMVKNSMDDIRYEYRDGYNTLTVTKHA